MLRAAKPRRRMTRPSWSRNLWIAPETSGEPLRPSRFRTHAVTRWPVRPIQSAIRSERTIATISPVTTTKATALTIVIVQAVPALLALARSPPAARATIPKSGRNIRLRMLMTP